MSLNFIHKAWENWLDAYDWDVFATLNFSRLNLLEGNKRDASAKLWRSYLSTVDRAIYGQTRKAQPRFNRLVFKHYGEGGTNPHVHILLKSPIDINEFCIALSAIWTSKIEPAASPDANSIG